MKRFLTIFLAFIVCLLPFAGCKKDNGKTVIELNEVTHSVFYAPLYLAIELGYFEEENIEISLTNGGGADKVMTAVVSKSADIGLMGPETVLYVMAQGKKDAPKVFADLTQKDGAFFEDACREVCINNISYGYRLFKQYMGVTPAEYKRSEIILKEKRA